MISRIEGELVELRDLVAEAAPSRVGRRGQMHQARVRGEIQTPLEHLARVSDVKLGTLEVPQLGRIAPRDQRQVAAARGQVARQVPAQEAPGARDQDDAAVERHGGGFRGCRDQLEAFARWARPESALRTRFLRRSPGSASFASLVARR